MNYGQFLKKLKQYCINKKIKNEDLVNPLLQPIVKTANIKKEKGDFKGELLYYEISESSRIINNRLDISPKIRDALNIPGIEEKIESAFCKFYDTNIDKTLIGDMIDDFLTAIESDVAFSKKEISCIKSYSNEPEVFLEKIMIKSLKEYNVINNSDNSIIWSNGDNYIRVIEGDIFNYALGRRSKHQRIVVIPVNTTFDTHVSNKLEGNSLPVVSNTTLHGKFLIRVYKSGITEEDIKRRILNDLSVNGLIDSKTDSISLPIGSIATLDFDMATIYLLAVSHFDEHNNAHSSEDEIREAVSCMMDYYDKKGQGYDLYMPLIGTGMSRARLSHQQSFDLIINTLLLNKQQIQGKINVVVQPKVMNNISIRKEL